MVKNNDLKQENIQKIKELLYQGTIYTKTELMSQCRLSSGSVTNVLHYLLSEEEIIYIGNAQSTGGRQSKFYQLNPNAHHIGMVVLKREHQNYHMYFKSYDLLKNCRFCFDIISETGTVSELRQNINDLLELDSLIDLLVISLPGVSENGTIDYCDYEQLNGLNLHDFGINVPIIVENDVNVGAIGFSKAYPDSQHLALCYQPSSDYVGCGVILSQKLYNGFSHFAGELRYLPLYSHSQQNELLKTNPQHLLMQQMTALCAVLNPQIIGYCSDVFEELTLSFDDYGIPKKHQPQLIHITNFNDLIEDGLFSIGIHQLLKKENI